MSVWAKPAVRAIVVTAFWIPLGVCVVVACTPTPGRVVAGLSGVVAHAPAFFYLTVALILAHFRKGPLVAVAIWLFAFGVVLEVTQLLFVTGRSGDLEDLAFNAVGIVLGCLAYAWLARPLGITVWSTPSVAAGDGPDSGVVA